MEYPFLAKIRSLLKVKGQSEEWLGAQIGKSRRWIYDIKSIESNNLVMIGLVSKALEFDFLKDYNQWLLDNDYPSLSLLEEPALRPGKKEKSISVEIKITGTPKSFAKGFAELIECIRAEGEKHGLEINS